MAHRTSRPSLSIFHAPGRPGPVADISATTPAKDGNAPAAAHRQLEELVASMRSRLAAVRTGAEGDGGVCDGELEAAYLLFVRVGGWCRALCRALLVVEVEVEGGGKKKMGRGRHWRAASLRDRQLGGDEVLGSGIGVEDAPVAGEERVGRVAPSAGHRRARFDGTEGCGEDGEGTTTTGYVAAGGPEPVGHAACVAAVAEWRACLDELAAAHKSCLTDTYKRYAQSATPEILDALFADRTSRARVVSGWMKNFGAYKRMQGQSGVWSKWEAQIRHYEEIVQELAEISSLLQGLDSGVTPDRVVSETVIAPRGDAVLEFANKAMNRKPILRFRVSSHMLAATSPIFASMFDKHAEPGLESDGGQPAQDEQAALPPPPTPFVCNDGTRTLLYRMPQLELDKESAFTILLHAAHMHNDGVPREVSLEQFVALAEASLRYRCTSPLELSVEHRWLPQWVHKATDPMPDGLVVISYAFGLRRLFTRVTKTAILNLVDERELAGKDWPKAIKDRIWAVRCAKMAQVHQTCARAVEEYLRPPVSTQPELSGCVSPDATEAIGGGSQTPTTLAGSPPRSESTYTSFAPSTLSAFSQPNTATTSTSLHTSPPSTRLLATTPRCPKGSHWCDATNLGWLMLVYNSLHILGPILNPDAVSLSSSQPPPPRSLAQIIECLRTTPSPPPPHHNHPDHHHRLGSSSSSSSSVCDPAPAFRAAVNDVYNSVAGLTLFEIDGARHGWALSARHAAEPQAVHHPSRGRTAAAVDELTAALGGLGLAAADEQPGTGGELLSAVMGDLRLSEAEAETVRGEGGGCETSPSPSPRTPADEAFGDEAVCLRILGAIDAFPDLRCAAVVNRSVYAVYKRHEPQLTRSVVGAGRRRTLALLEGGDDGLGDRNDDDEEEEEQKKCRRRRPSSSRLDADRNNSRPESGPPDLRRRTGTTATGDEDAVFSVSVDLGESESASGTAETAPSTTVPSESSENTAYVRTESPAPSSSGISRRSALSRRSTVNPYFKMTEEEARRILWGEPSPPLSPLLSAPQVRAFRPVSHVVEDTKFGASGRRMVVENKMLVTGGNKQLREDMDRRIGLG